MRHAHSRTVVLRDLAIFHLKTLLDGAKGIALVWVATAAAVVDLLLPGERPGRFFYRVMRLGEKADSWLNLYGAAETASADEDGLFGRSRAGSHTLLGRLEQIVRGEEDSAYGKRRMAS